MYGGPEYPGAAIKETKSATRYQGDRPQATEEFVSSTTLLTLLVPGQFGCGRSDGGMRHAHGVRS